MKIRIKMIALLLFVLILISLSFSSCLHLSGNDIDTYHSFYEVMSSSKEYNYDRIIDFLPEVTDEDVLEFNVNLIENIWELDYVVYLKCSFPEEAIYEEKIRLEQNINNGSPVSITNDENNFLDWDSIYSQSGTAILEYVVWREDGTFVYVITQTYYPKIVKDIIPEEYWPPFLDDNDEASDFQSNSKQDNFFNNFINNYQDFFENLLYFFISPK